MPRRNIPYLAAAALAMALALLLALAWAAGLQPVAQDAPPLAVHFIDLGQGDAILLQTPTAAVLVDGGPSDGGAAAYLWRLGLRRLDLVVATHAHADHIGGLAEVLQRFAVDEVWYNGQVHPTQTFERFIAAIEQSGALYHEPVRGETRQTGELVLEVLHPTASAAAYTGHLHDQNIVLRARLGNFAVLLTGDAEAAVEAELLAAGLPLHATVLKLGHHGSRTSSTPDFVAAAAPQVAVYQAGRDNPYGHPHAETLRTVAGITIYGTDRHGTVVITTDGYRFGVHTERQALPRAPPP